MKWMYSVTFMSPVNVKFKVGCIYLEAGNAKKGQERPNLVKATTKDGHYTACGMTFPRHGIH